MINMAYYYEGYQEARKALLDADLETLLQHVDTLYGRDNIEDESDIEEVRREALRQCQKDFTDTSSEEYKSSTATVNFWTNVIKASEILKQ